MANQLTLASLNLWTHEFSSLSVVPFGGPHCAYAGAVLMGSQNYLLILQDWNYKCLFSLCLILSLSLSLQTQRNMCLDKDKLIWNEHFLFIFISFP